MSDGPVTLTEWPRWTRGAMPLPDGPGALCLRQMDQGRYPSWGDKRGLRLTLPPGLPWRSWCHLRVRPLDAPPVPWQQKLFERLTTRSASSVKLARYIDQAEGGGVPWKLRDCHISPVVESTDHMQALFSSVVESSDHMLPCARQLGFEPHWRFSFASMKKYRFFPRDDAPPRGVRYIS